MTDEEMADEYVKKEGFRVDMFGGLDDITSSEANEEINQAFLAGLKAGRPQWHDLRKDPNDLPNTDRNVWVKRESESECQIDNYYKDDKGWGIMFREGYCTDDVIAWCELPTFNKE